MIRIRALLPALLLVLLAACVPVVGTLPPENPIFFNARYDALFDATLQEMTSIYLSLGGTRLIFAITEADRDTGLISAVRNQRGPRSSFSFRGGRYYERERDRRDDADIGDGFFFGPFFRVYVPVPARESETTLISVVLRPAERGATLIYSSSGPNGTASRNADRFMAAVVDNLRERFPSPQSEPTAPQNP